jgi:dTDP-4-dehydrorhamnose reductase
MIVVTGVTGQLGHAFRRRLGDDDAVYLDRSMCDLADPASIAGVIEPLGPSTVINCAAYTAVDAAESEPDVADAVNARSVGELAAICSRIGARFVTFSTDYVFDGTKEGPYVESDRTMPINVYGATKRRGEQLALEALPSSLIIRTSWVMSGTHRSFASVMLERIAAGTVSVVADQHGHPTFADDLVAGTLAAMDTGAGGILHVTNEGVASWFDIAVEIARIAGLDESRVAPCGTEDYRTPARRPRNSVLDSERRGPLGLSPLRDFREPLAEAIAQLSA